jgi:hypothetical protein
MGKIPSIKSDMSQVELYAAIADAAKSMNIAAKRVALRAKMAATLADAAKVTYAADTLRAAAMEGTEQNQTGLAFESPATVPGVPEDTWTRVIPQDDAADEFYARCNSLQNEDSVEQKKQDERCTDTTTPILELFDRFGGFIKH